MSNWKPPYKPQPEITRSRAMCMTCLDVIESKHRHDFVSCKCRKDISGWRQRLHPLRCTSDKYRLHSVVY